MAERGWGRNPPIDYAELAALSHRREHLSAVLSLARKHDAERQLEAEIQRELEELDRAILRGTEGLPEERRRRLLRSLADDRAHRQEQGQGRGAPRSKAR